MRDFFNILNMKYLIILGDGMADEPIPSLGNKTILQAANTPTMDLLAKKGRNGLLATVPAGLCVPCTPQTLTKRLNG